MDNTLMAAMFQTPAVKMSMPFLATAEVKKERVCEIRHGKCLCLTAQTTVKIQPR